VPPPGFAPKRGTRCHDETVAENDRGSGADPVVADQTAARPVQSAAAQAPTSSRAGTPSAPGGSGAESAPFWLPEAYRPPPGRASEGAGSAPTTPPATATPESGRPAVAQPRRRDQLLWLWPALSLLVVAMAGEIWGTYGSLLAGLLAMSTLVLLLGNEVVHGWSWLAVAIAATAAITAVVVAHRAGVAVLAGRKAAAAQTAASQRQPVDLRGQRVTVADIQGRDLRGALLAGAVLDGLDLTRVRLNGADARGASFRDANLEWADLRGADLSGSDLRRACLSHVDLSGARLYGANAREADVSSVSVAKGAAARAAVWPRPSDRPPSDVCT
jgi:hypothetical protein